jgi:glycosyltransferase involved in cell wall biosynthesis
MYVLLNFWRFDTVITLIGPHTILFPGLVASVLRRSWIIDIYDFWLDNAVDMGFTTENAIGYRLLAVVERISLNRADHILVLTPTLGEQYREKYNLEKEKFTSVPFGIDLEMFSPDSARDSHERIIYTGKLGKAQAFEPFFEGFARLDVDYELLIVGFGDRRDELERLATSLGIDERVTFRDAVSRNQIPELVSSSTVSLVPLSKEYQIEYARPTKFVETMAVGTPFIASNLPEITSVTERSEAGIVVPNEPTAITNAMNKIINDNKLRTEMRENGVAFSEEYHCWDRIANKVEIVISNVEHDPNEEEL